MKKNIIVLSIVIILVSLLTFIYGFFVNSFDLLWLRISFGVIINLANAGISLVAIKVTRMKIDFKWKNYKQYIIGIVICVVLSLVIAWIPALLGTSLVGDHAHFVLWKFIYNLVNYLLIIGPVEELIFRVYIQGTLVDFFKSSKWIGVLIASFLFGLWHIINGNLIQVIFTFGIGCVFGFAKQYIKDLHYPGVALSHGLYDFLNYVVRLTIV